MMPFDEAILTERANLVNNPNAHPDVTFLVGPEKIEVTAHKVFLVSASEVFKAMFSENFATDAKIKVKDMEVNAFTEVLCYCYSLKATFTEKNMLGILYGAEKYMLPGLMAQGVLYVLPRISADNCLKIYNATHLLDLNCSTVIDKCLAHFQKRPKYYFLTDPAFDQLSLPALKKLAALPIMNCSGASMKAAVARWFLLNGYCVSVKDAVDDIFRLQGFAAESFGVKTVHYLMRFDDHLVCSMNKYDIQSNTTRLNFESQRSLVGAGIVGIRNRHDELVKLTINQGQQVLNSIERIVKRPRLFTNIEIQFDEPVTVVGTVSIKVDFQSNKRRTAITNSFCSSSDHLVREKCVHFENGLHADNFMKMWPDDPNVPYTCIAYLLFHNAKH